MRRNNIATALKVLGAVILICSIAIGFAMIQNDSTEYVVGTGIGIMFAGLASCLFLMGLAEIIELLQKNIDKKDEVIDVIKQQTIIRNNKREE